MSQSGPSAGDSTGSPHSSSSMSQAQTVLLGVLIVLYVGTQLAASAVTAISADPRM